MKPLTEADIEAPNPWEKAKEDNKLNCHWLAGIIKDTGKKTEDGKVRLQSAGLFAKIDGLLQERIEHTITLEDQLRAIHKKREND